MVLRCSFLLPRWHSLLALRPLPSGGWPEAPPSPPWLTRGPNLTEERVGSATLSSQTWNKVSEQDRRQGFQALFDWYIADEVPSSRNTLC